jgi:hypothetical protein
VLGPLTWGVAVASLGAKQIELKTHGKPGCVAGARGLALLVCMALSEIE